MSQVRIPISNWLTPNESCADLTVFDAEDCGGTQRICIAVYCGPSNTHLRMTRREVGDLIDALSEKLAS